MNNQVSSTLNHFSTSITKLFKFTEIDRFQKSDIYKESRSEYFIDPQGELFFLQALHAKEKYKYSVNGNKK